MSLHTSIIWKNLRRKCKMWLSSQTWLNRNHISDVSLDELPPSSPSSPGNLSSPNLDTHETIPLMDASALAPTFFKSSDSCLTVSNLVWWIGASERGVAAVALIQNRVVAAAGSLGNRSHQTPDVWNNLVWKLIWPALVWTTAFWLPECSSVTFFFFNATCCVLLLVQLSAFLSHFSAWNPVLPVATRFSLSVSQVV